MQYMHVLENPDKLSDSLILLTHTRREIMTNANAAPISGGEAVSNIIQEFDHIRYLASTKSSPQTIQARLRVSISFAHESFRATSDYMLPISLPAKTAREVAWKNNRSNSLQDFAAATSPARE
ncbi:hypothetical protein FRB95_014023 [Tulasnella sp. JGI-2019a]|nr:hypothetical protein FRB93_001706 [Tulasnella sp. JGI-2019a]KAG9033944.1 hypothetical protein FRB95_014023 [Tulasnella sp. JGI-2019a]